MEDRRTAANGTHPPTHIRQGGATSNPSHGSRTITIDPAQEQHDESNASDDEVGVLRLRGDMSARRPRAIQWDESVVDNEHMNKKKSKICCIYHKPHAVGESSESESDSSSSSSSDSDSSGHGDNCGHRHSNRKKKKRNPRAESPNAYERQPNYNKDRPRK